MKSHILIGFCLLVIFIGGCAQPPSSNSIVIWHWMTDRQNAFEELATRYEQQTGIKVSFQLYAPSDVYSQKVIAAAQARILPDIYGVLDKKSVVGDFIKSGYIADLTTEFKRNDGAWEKSFFPKALAVNRFEENNTYGIPAGIYGVPLDVTNIQMLYNKKLLAKAGIEQVPKTFAEFLEAVEALNRVGIVGLASGWGEMWMVDCFASNYAFNIMGEDKVMATFRGEVPYTDPDWISVFQIFQTLAQRNAFIPGIVTKANKYAEQDFALERAAFAFNGSWCVNVYHDMNPDLEYGVMLPPPISQKFPMSIWGGAGSSLVVNQSSPNQVQAIAFLKWLTAKEQQAFLAKATMNLPANREVMTTIPDMLLEFTAGMEYTTHQTIWPLDEDALVKEKFDKGVQAIIIGEKTPTEVAREVQEVKEKQTERQKKRQNR